MKLNEIIEFRKDLYFEGAVQIDWFYDKTKSKTVAENFVFHGSEYFGIANTGSNKRIDTISLTQELLQKTGNAASNPLSLAIADYGTGKSHLAVTLGHLFSGPDYCPETYQKILDNIAGIDKKAANEIKEQSKKKNLVLVINGMKDFNLHSELLKAAQKSLTLHGVSDEKLRKINKSIEIAELFFDRNAVNSLKAFESKAEEIGWREKGEELIRRIKDTLLTDSDTFELINSVYEDINGHKIRWDEDISAAAILDQLINEYCGINGAFDGVVLLFDEFGRYLEYASGTDSARSGESALQQIFECSQNADGLLHVINFIQSDIKSYLQRVDNTKNISRYIGRYDVSDKYYISSNLETVFANLIQRKDSEQFEKVLINGLNARESYWNNIFDDLNTWKTLSGVWAEYSLFRKVIVEGIYPMHPISTFMLTQLSDYLQNRSSLTMISQYINSNGNQDIENGKFSILPEELMRGDLYTEMLSAEQEGRQTSQHCLRYSNILSKFEDKLSENALKVLRSNLVLRILRFKTNSLSEVKNGLMYCSGLTVGEIDEELNILTNEYGILGYDDRANCFDFMEESHGAHDYKIFKKRLLSRTEFDSGLLTNNEVLELGDLLNSIDTQFSTNRHISTKEWEFRQELYAIEELSQDILNKAVSDWENAIQPEVPKGKLIWLYVNKNTDSVYIDRACKAAKVLEGKPIILMLLNDTDNHLYTDLVEYKVLKDMDDASRSRFGRHYEDDVNQNRVMISTDFANLKKDRQYLTVNGVARFNDRLAKSLTSVFDNLYPNIISFPFDGFVSAKYNISRNQAKTYISIVRALLSGEINDAVIHNWPTDTRNRFSALFDAQARNSWKCFSDQSHIIPPEDKAVRSIYDVITNKLEEDELLSCAELLETLSKPPYGLNYYAVVILVALVISNLSYCTRVVYKENIYNSQAWRDLLLVKDSKTNPDVFKDSSLKHVDANAVNAKFNQLFNQIDSNKDADKVAQLEAELNQMTQENDLPDELLGRYNLMLKILHDGKNAKNDFNNLFMSISEDKQKIHPRDLYPAVKMIIELMNTDFRSIFEKYNYKYTETYSSQVTNLLIDMKGYVEDNFGEFLKTIRCAEVERMVSFRNHTNRLFDKFTEAGFTDYANIIREQAGQELHNVELIKSRANFRDNYYDFYKRCNITAYTPYTQINDWKKECSDLIKRFNMFSATIKDASKIAEGIKEKQALIKNELANIRKEIGDIFEDAYDLCDINGIENLNARISNAIRRGFDENNENALKELQGELAELKEKIVKLAALTVNREEFDDYAEQLLQEYKDADSELLTDEYIERFIDFYREEMNQLENDWINDNMDLGEETANDIYEWKNTVDNLPKYLSKETQTKIAELDAKADVILREQRIETAVHYFQELDDKEKELFFEKIGKNIKQ